MFILNYFDMLLDFIKTSACESYEHAKLKIVELGKCWKTLTVLPPNRRYDSKETLLGSCAVELLGLSLHRFQGYIGFSRGENPPWYGITFVVDLWVVWCACGCGGGSEWLRYIVIIEYAAMDVTNSYTIATTFYNAKLYKRKRCQIQPFLLMFGVLLT